MSAPPDAGAGGALAAALGERERFRDAYLAHRDPIAADRMLWRAQTFRHLVHLLPGETVLELGCGSGAFTRALAGVTRGENPITAVSFTDASPNEGGDPLPPSVTVLRETALPGSLAGRRFDYVVAMDALDDRTAGDVLQRAHDLLRPGGALLCYESNPWNPVLRLRRLAGRLVGWRDPRALLGRRPLYELMSEVGFIRVFAVYNDFVYAPLSRRLVWLLRNLSIMLENAPGVRTLAGSILVHAQAPPRVRERPRVALGTHPALRGAVSVVVPCHNEAMNVGPLVARLLELYGDYIHEVVLVDDNSRDGTRAAIEALAAAEPRVRPVYRTPPNGVGRAIADGYRAATGRYVLSMDCDFQHLLPEVRDLFDAAAEGYDVVVGSRFSRHSVLLNYPFAKIVANRGFHALAKLALRRSFRDVTNNLKLIRREVVERLCLLEPGFAVNAETGLQPLLMGCSVKEVPISWINRAPDMGSSSFRLVKVGGGYWQVLRRLWLRDVFGRGAYRALPVSPDRRPQRPTPTTPAAEPVPRLTRGGA